MQREKNKEMRSEHSYVSNAVNLRSGQVQMLHTHTLKMTWTIIKITKIDDHQKLSAPIRVAKLFAKTATVFAAESVSLYGNEVNTYTYIQTLTTCTVQ